MKAKAYFAIPTLILLLTLLIADTNSRLISAPLRGKELKLDTPIVSKQEGAPILLKKFISDGETAMKFRQKRSLLGFEETLLGVSPGQEPSLKGRRRQRPFQRPMRPRPPYSRPPFGMGSSGICRPYSCVNNCPRDCDSLCSLKGECFCSCAEDEVIYEYHDTPSFDTESIYFY